MTLDAADVRQIRLESRLPVMVAVNRSAEDVIQLAITWTGGRAHYVP